MTYSDVRPAKDSTIGERIRFYRERAEMGQVELAEALTAKGASATQGHVSRMELYGSGDENARKPQWRHMCALAETFDVRIPDLGATEDEYPELRFMREGIASRAKLNGISQLSPALTVVTGHARSGDGKPTQMPLAVPVS